MVQYYDEVRALTTTTFVWPFGDKTYKYKFSTFSRAHGVVRKNRNDDLTLGSMQNI